jgi:putative protein-disulfide isomerase
MESILYYIHDPMCSWCWAFCPTWREIKARLSPNIRIHYVLGDLAPDTEQPMPLDLQQKIQRIWEKIQKEVPDTEFNFDFWAKCQPRRSTYPACRAIIAATRQGREFEDAMILQIQRAYYLQARNPSNDDTLIALATELGLNKERFINDLNSLQTKKELAQQIQFSQMLGARGFPSLILKQLNDYHPISINYKDPSAALSQIKALHQSYSPLKTSP